RDRGAAADDVEGDGDRRDGLGRAEGGAVRREGGLDRLEFGLVDVRDGAADAGDGPTVGGAEGDVGGGHAAVLRLRDARGEEEPGEEGQAVGGSLVHRCGGWNERNGASPDLLSRGAQRTPADGLTRIGRR